MAGREATFDGVVVEELDGGEELAAVDGDRAFEKQVGLVAVGAFGHQLGDREADRWHAGHHALAERGGGQGR